MLVETFSRLSEPKEKTMPSNKNSNSYTVTLANGKRKAMQRNRSRISAQNLMEGDECLLRGGVSLYVHEISRNEAKGTVKVFFDDGNRWNLTWDQKVSIRETPERHAYRRNSLRRNGYPNYLAEVAGYIEQA